MGCCSTCMPLLLSGWKNMQAAFITVDIENACYKINACMPFCSGGFSSAKRLNNLWDRAWFT